LRRLLKVFETDSSAYLRTHIIAVCRRGEQDVDREQHCLYVVERPPA
jgi:hypothetical protein